MGLCVSCLMFTDHKECSESAHEAVRDGYRKRERKVRWEKENKSGRGRLLFLPLTINPCYLTLPFAARCMKTTWDESEAGIDIGKNAKYR